MMSVTARRGHSNKAEPVLLLGAVVMAILVNLGCGEAALSAEDARALARARACFPTELQVVPDDSGLLRVHELRPAVADVDKKFRVVFNTFFELDGKRRARTDFSSLALYGFDGRFRYALVFDPDTGKVVERDRP